MGAIVSRRNEPPDWWGFFTEPTPPLSEVGVVRVPRREQREKIKQALAVVKAAKKAGHEVKSATIDGVVLEFGRVDAPAPTNELDRWLLKHPDYAHSTQEH